MSKDKIVLVMEEVMEEVVEKTIHIKTVGRILVDYKMNNIENINYVSSELRKKGVNIRKG